jgi:hypothetical protein
MIDLADIADLGGQGAADAVVANRASLVAAEAREFVLAAHWADLHAPVDEQGLGAGGSAGDGGTARRRVLPGTERVRRIGGPGTPMVGEFAAGELALLLGVGLAAASNLMADALDVRHRLPELWAEVTAGRVRVWQAREVARRTRATGLSLEQAQWVAARVTPYLGRLSWARFCQLLEARIVEADPDAAEARRRAAALERFVATGQSNEYGLSTIIAKTTAGDAIFFVAVCDRIAQILELEGDTDSVGVRRSKAIGLLATPERAFALLAKHSTSGDRPLFDGNPGDEADESSATGGGGDAGEDDASEAGGTAGAAVAQRAGDPTAFVRAAGIDPAKLRPRAVLYLHLGTEAFHASLAGDQVGVVRMEGVGPITVEQCREFLAHCQVTVKPVIDLNAEDQPADSYEVPDRIRERLRLRSPGSVFPYSPNQSRTMDADHTVPWRPPGSAPSGDPPRDEPGQTRTGNLGFMGRREHRLKTHGTGWRHRQPETGVHVWRTPHGYWFRVDSHGTHALGKNPLPSQIGEGSVMEQHLRDLLAAA